MYVDLWWVQAKIMMGSLNGCEKDRRKRKCLEAAEKEWAFIRDRVNVPKWQRISEKAIFIDLL